MPMGKGLIFLYFKILTEKIPKKVVYFDRQCSLAVSEAGK